MCTANGVNGVLFHTPTVDAVVDAIRRLDSIDAGPAALARAAERFSVEKFRQALEARVTEAVERRRAKVG